MTALAQSECLLGEQASAIAAGTRLHGLGDVDGDGHVDALIGQDELKGGRATSYLTVARGDGRGHFVLGQALAVGERRWSASMADVDGDGRMDVLATGMRETGMLVLLGRANGSLTRARSVHIGRRVGQVLATRVDRDAHVDAVVAMRDELRVLRGDGRGRFRQVARVPSLGEYPGTPAVVDIDGDGALDLVIANNDAGGIALARGRGDGTFFATQTLGEPCAAPVSAVSGDFDRDGRADAVVSCSEPRLVFVRGGQGGGGAPAMELVQGPNDNAFLSVGDLTGDGVLDLFAMRPQRIAVAAGDGAGHFESIATVEENAGIFPLVADVDEDGRPDAVSIRMVGPALQNLLVVRSGRDCGRGVAHSRPSVRATGSTIQ